MGEVSRETYGWGKGARVERHTRCSHKVKKTQMGKKKKKTGLAEKTRALLRGQDSRD